MLDVHAYLRRVGYEGPRAPGLQTLRDLHLAHLMAVPFENLDIALGRLVSLEEGAIYDKIVARRRGGFCYELNGLFACLLRAMGFHVTLLSAQVVRDEGGFGPDFDHLTLRVELDSPWLVDVGFGDSFREPLSLDTVTSRGDYRLGCDGKYWSLSRCQDSLQWKEQYRFTLEPRVLSDFTDMCRYHQTSPESLFTRKRLCTLATPEGRKTLSDLRFIVTAGNQRVERSVSEGDEYRKVLGEEFGISFE